jgi:hypothetical protein
VQVSAVSVSEWRTWYRLIAYEDSKGYEWQWVASRYHYFWNIHETPLNFQVHGLYQMVYDDLLHSTRYQIVPPDENPVLDNLTYDYALNQWNFWWKSDEFSWWMGRQKIAAMLAILIGAGLASGVYIAAESSGLWDQPLSRRLRVDMEEAA